MSRIMPNFALHVHCAMDMKASYSITYRIFTAAVALLASLGCAFAQRQLDTGASHKKDGPAQIAYAWSPLWPSGQHEEAPMDTLEYNYFQRSIPSQISYAYACTGNLGAEGKNMLFMQQRPISEFFLQDAQMAWTPTYSSIKFYNTRIPMTQVSYNTGGGRENAQDRLQMLFSANAGKKTQIGANLDYIYSKGSYDNQAAKGLIWGLSGSHMGDRLEVQASWNHYNLLNKENGGITDDLYITDPAQLQGGVSTINPKSIPTRLSHAHTKIVGGELFLNGRYKVGYWHEEEIDDTTTVREYIPFTAFFYTLNFKNAKHIFLDENMAEMNDYYGRAYLNPDITDDRTHYSSLANTAGVSLLEGFNKYAKFGLSAFVTYEIRKYKQAVDTLDRTMEGGLGLTPFPGGIESTLARKSQNLAWAGAQISKQQGSILTYEATGQIGFLGDAVGEIKIDGRIRTRIPLLGDTVGLTAYGSLRNTAPSYLLQEYISNHFIWQNSFSKERRLRFGGILTIPWTNTAVNIGTETLQNLIYFDENSLPAQNGGGVQVFSATLDQNFKVGVLHWNNKVTFQTSSNDAVMPLPKLALYSNLYILCRIATLHLQLGMDCNYYSKYYAPAYQPATATFYNQREMKLGNYPFMNLYANMKLGSVRFYVMMSHINQGMLSNDYFSSPHYPLNPRRFQMGLSVDFLD